MRTGFTFQSTLPHGSDDVGIVLVHSVADFNPRSLTGATDSDYAALVASIISIHAPSRERRESTVIWDEDTAISIHAPSRERRDAW